MIGHTVLLMTFCASVLLYDLYNTFLQSLPSHPHLRLESVNIGPTAKECLQELHLVLTASSFRHHLPVAKALDAAHWVLVEDNMKHIGRVQLRSVGEVMLSGP